MPRCAWCGTDPLYIDYHDREWGVPARDPQVLFEFLLLEAFQAGLSWITVLRKRERYRQVLFGFDAERLARSNARAWLQLEDPAGFVWSFVGGEPKINRFERLDQVPAVSPEAEAMSRALKKAGFSFVGPTICYAYMQACGMVMDHLIDCERHAALVGGD